MSTYLLVGFIGDWRDSRVSLGKYQPVVRCEQTDEYFRVQGNVYDPNRLIPVSPQNLGYVNLFEESCQQAFDVEVDGECLLLQSYSFLYHCVEVIELEDAEKRLKNDWFDIRFDGVSTPMSGVVGQVTSSLEAKEFIETLYRDLKNFFFPRIFFDSEKTVSPILKVCMSLLSALPRACDEDWLVLQGVYFYQKLMSDDFELVEKQAELQFGLSPAEFKNKVMERINWASEGRFVLKRERTSFEWGSLSSGYEADETPSELQLSGAKAYRVYENDNDYIQEKRRR